MAKTAAVSVVHLQNGPAQMIQPAHEDWITKIATLDDKVMTASLDSKIKIWGQ